MYHRQLDWFQNWATATGSLVAVSCVRSSFSFFFGPTDRTFKHYSVLSSTSRLLIQSLLKKMMWLVDMVGGKENVNINNLKLSHVLQTHDLFLHIFSINKYNYKKGQILELLLVQYQEAPSRRSRDTPLPRPCSINHPNRSSPDMTNQAQLGSHSLQI